MPSVSHPKCGKRYPANNTHGHCAACCETFVGLTAFDAHIGENGCQIKPYKVEGRKSYGHWLDEKGFYHYGKKLTEEEKRSLWG